jgi:hypothetical protein
MDQDSTNSGERRNWRERLGIAKDNSKELPKISEEFRSENDGKPAEPRLVTGPSAASPMKPLPSDAPAAPAPAARGHGSTPVRPAPMAPRSAAATGAARPPQNQQAGNPVSPQTPRPAPPAGQAKPQAAPSARVPAPAASARGASTPAPAAANGSGSAASDDFAERLRQQREAAERLARQRAATARAQGGAPPPPLAKPPEAAPSAPRFSFAPDELAGDAKPAPAAAAAKAPQRPAAPNGGQPGWQPPFQAAPAPSPYAPPRSPGYPYGQQSYQPQRMAAPAYSRSPQQGQAAPPQAPYAAAGYGQESWNGAETIARPAPPRGAVPQRAESYAGQAEHAYGNTAEDVYADPSRARRPVPVPARAAAVRPRLPEPEEQEQDELYEAERRPERQPNARQQRAQVADYNNAYREYDEDYVEEEPRGRGGPLILLLALLALALIVGVLIFFYTQNFNLPSSSAAANHDIPVIAPSEGPAKATPEPQVDTPTPAPGPAAASSAPPQPLQGRKQIYDRILGEEAVEQNKLVPTEEQPVQPQRGGDGQDSGPATTGGGAPLPEPAPDSGTPAETRGHDGAAPEPLPLPPPPGVQGSYEPPAPADGAEAATSRPEPQTDRSAGGDDTLIEPTSEQSEGNPEPDLLKPTASHAQAEPAQTAAAEAPASTKGTSSDRTSSQGSVGAVAPSATAKAKPPRAAKAETAVPPTESETIVDTLPPPPGAVAGSPSSLGVPVRLGQGQPVSPAGSAAYSGQAAVPQGGAKPAYFDQFQRQAQQSPSAAQRPQRTGRDVDPLDGLRTPLSGRSSVAVPPPQQLAMAEPPPAALPPAAPPPASFAGQQASVQPPAQAAQAPPAARAQQPSAQRITPAPAPAPRPQQQAALIPATAPAATPAVATGTGYVVQLASFRSEAEAAGEFRRLQSRHPQLVGALQQRIQRADLGASGTFYRLGVGPLVNKDQASRLCNSLIAAGEKDCLVRRQ